MTHWAKGVAFSTVSTAAVAWIQIRPTPEPGFAGAAFVYNLTFFFPLALVSLAFWITAFVFYVLFVRQGAQRTTVKIVLPLLLLVACPYQLTVIALVLYQFHQLHPSA